ncbi:MAG: dihydrofolate reductase [Bacteroidetes bacterium QS_7_67_15]|nr:MAG: dihydrofolate reductase [Bacteroidetes bacterium QS_7_67_15]
MGPLFRKISSHVSVPEIVLIAAVAEANRVIGDGKKLPWHLPEDLARFKRLTRGHPLLMGRRTFQSIVHQFGGPLPERRHLVLTREGPPADFPDIEAAASIDEALALASGAERLFVGGGANVYEAFLTEPFLGRVDRLELTLVEGRYEGDTFFPEWRPLVGPVFEKTAETPKDGFRFVTYRRVAQGA